MFPAVTVVVFVQCIIKQLLDSVFVISRIIKVSVLKNYSLNPAFRGDLTVIKRS